MKFSTAVIATCIAATCIAAETVARSVVDGATCSSLNGPFCAGFESEFASAPLHVRQSLDIGEEEIKAAKAAKNLKIEKVVKQYGRQVAVSDTDALDEDTTRDIQNMLEENMALLSELDGDDTNPMAGAFAFNSENGAFELLERMDGDGLKDFFETALDEVLLSVDTALEEPAATEGLRTTVWQLKALDNYSTYAFERLDESELAGIRHKFANHRLVELQQTFEQLVTADDAHDRQLALETVIYLFQLAQEEAKTASSQ